MGLKLVLPIMLQVLIPSTLYFFGLCACICGILIMACMKLAYCTGLLLARRVLKTLKMDDDYEGNVEVCIAIYCYPLG